MGGPMHLAGMLVQVGWEVHQISIKDPIKSRRSGLFLSAHSNLRAPIEHQSFLNTKIVRDSPHLRRIPASIPLITTVRDTLHHQSQPPSLDIQPQLLQKRRRIYPLDRQDKRRESSGTA